MRSRYTTARVRLTYWFESIWYQENPPPFWLKALAQLYGLILQFRLWLYHKEVLSSVQLPVPVIIIGNWTVGGTGKTPLTQWMCRKLISRGWRPGVVMRGYQGSQKVPLLVEADIEPSCVGDEAVLLARSVQCPVVVGRDRVAATRYLLDHTDCDVVIADDGLQHLSLARDIEIVVMDGQRRLGNERLLPAGPLREPINGLKRINFRVVNGGDPCANEVLMQVLGNHAQLLSDQTKQIPLSFWCGKPVHAVAGIGNPERFFCMLESYGLQVIRHPWPDHHQFRGDELVFDQDSYPVFITEKDAIKCLKFQRNEYLYVVPVEAVLPDLFLDKIHNALLAIKVERN